ncbi:hypothetical protein OG21DRAFT_1490763 [Imleria badia]|nr:hypothetical protein OG21DRAFT_1490763 [Imleria badia]
MSLLARFRLEHTLRPSNDAEGSADASAGDNTNTRADDSGRLFFPPSSPVCESSSSLEPPPPGQRQRERSDSAEEVLQRESQQRCKRRCAIQVCRDLELAENALTAFTEIKDEVNSFIKSDDFKDVLQDRLRTALLSANLSHYLNGLNDRVWGFIKKNLTVFNIPPLAMEDARLTIHINTLMKDVLTKQRSQIKTKITASISKKHHISDLAKSLAGRDFVDVTFTQWRRFAFLQNYLLFNTMVDESLVKKVTAMEPQEDADNDSAASADETPSRTWSGNQFWEFIDQLLDEMREDIRKKPTAQLRKQAWEQYFTDMLQLDLELFPAENRSASLHPLDGRSAPEWQKAIHQDLAWL